MMFIVHVDDDLAFQRAVQKEFTAQQFDIATFNNAIEAFNYLDRLEPDMVLVDFKLGGPNGIKLAQRIRERYSACAIVLISAYATKFDVREAFRSGADDFLFKPIDMHDLVLEILEAFRRRRMFYQRVSSQSKPAANQLLLDEINKIAIWNNQSIKLTTIEFHLLTVLVSDPQRLFNSGELYLAATGNPVSEEKAKAIIGVHMVNVRRKLQSTGLAFDPILNVRGKGYKWVTQDETLDVQQTPSASGLV
jgi:DNA-binding response OmpR family regulator